MSLLKAFRIVLVSAVIVCFTPLKTSLGCGGGDYYFGDSHYSFYDDLAFFPKNPYKDLNFSEFWFDDTPQSRIDLNLNDWKRYLGAYWTNERIKALIYTTELEQLKETQNGGKSVYLDSLMTNLFTNKRQPLLKYLHFAKTCEPQVDSRSITNSWYESRDNRNINLMDSLITVGLQLHKELDSDFLKERMAYQVVRLAHYAHHNERCIELFDSLWQKPTNSLMYYWSLSHKAGAYHFLGEYEQAAYYFSKVIKSNTGRNVQAIRGFELQNQEQWNKALALCENNSEQANLWFAQSIGLHERSLPGIKAIDSLTGNEEMLLHLFGRDIIRMEEVLSFSNSGYFSFEYSGAYYHKLYAFVDSLTSGNSNLKYSSQWEFGKGYLQFLSNQYEKAKSHFKTMNALLENDSTDAAETLKDQAELVGLIMKYRYAKWNHQLEDEVVADLKFLNDNNHDEAYSFLLEIVLKARLKHHGETMDAFMQNDFYGFLDHPTNYDLDELISKYTQENKTPFEQFFVNRFYYQLGDLYYFKATDFMIQNQLDSAKAYYKRAQSYPRKGYYRTRTMANIEENKIKSCNDCDYEEFVGEPQRMTQIIDRIKSLKYSINAPYANPESSAKKAMILGNIYYNLSGSGNCWYMLRFTFGGTEISINNPENEEDSKRGSSLAYDYYKQAFDRTSDKELKAHLLFLMAMCEQDSYYADTDYEYNWYSSDEEDSEYKDENYRHHFSKLIKDYKETKFFARALNECGYLGGYMERNKSD